MSFDRSFLPPALYEFAVIADTHYMLDVSQQPVEFESRRQQSARTELALSLVARLETPLVVHMGDLVQEFPERPNFAQAVEEAREQLKRCGVHPRFVAGNHDVGDKPDPTMPANEVTTTYLAAYHQRFGPSWYSWDEADVHFVVLNSQILNAPLPQTRAQRRWLEQDLARNQKRRLFVFLHLPPFLQHEREPGLGHYDNIDEPARQWLLDQVRTYKVELLLAAHVHWSFYDKIGATAFYTVPSVAFTRPGFSELFSGPPPNEQGRDDVDKLGFFLVRVMECGSCVHFIRTEGETAPLLLTRDADDSTVVRRLISCTSPDVPTSPLGLVLHHPLANEAEVPSVWPSSVRQPVRNDYPLLSALELGVRSVRVPASDLEQPLQKERLALLRQEGVQVTAAWLWHGQLDLVAEAGALGDTIDGIELQIPGSLLPSSDCLTQSRVCVEKYELPVTLSTVLPGKSVDGKQHARSQRGFLPEQLPKLDHHMQQLGAFVARVLCRIDPEVGPWNVLSKFGSLLSLPNIGGVDWILAPTDRYANQPANQVAEALFAAALHSPGKLFIEPFLDLDRTMDTACGLLDRICNPRPAFHVARHLNTLLYSPHGGIAGSGWTETALFPHVSRGNVLGIANQQQALWLVLPAFEQRACVDLGDLWLSNSRKRIQYFELVSGRCSSLNQLSKERTLAFSEPTLIVVPFTQQDERA